MNTQKLLILLCVLFCFATSASAQIWKDWEIKGGLVYNNPTVELQNYVAETHANAGYNLCISKLIPIFDWWQWEIGLGHTRLNWSQSRERFNYLVDLNTDYTYLGTGFRVQKKIYSFKPYLGGTFRIGRLVENNFRDLGFFEPKTIDYGIDYKIGIGYEKWKVKPFIEFSYFGALGYVYKMNLLSYNPDTEVSTPKNSEIQNRVIGISTGIRF
ncbi:MAG: hypothetical protein ACFCUU_08635 [Cyclobacteriaceae bacterium]